MSCQEGPKTSSPYAGAVAHRSYDAFLKALSGGDCVIWLVVSLSCGSSLQPYDIIIDLHKLELSLRWTLSIGMYCYCNSLEYISLLVCL